MNDMDKVIKWLSVFLVAFSAGCVVGGKMDTAIYLILLASWLWGVSNDD